MTVTPASEPILEPELPIVDSHHHLWDHTPQLSEPPSNHPFEAVLRGVPVYLFREALVDLQGGHNIRATVHVECGSMYRADGPAHLKSVGETEFANGVAAMAASGQYGEVRVCAGIVGAANLGMGDVVEDVLRAHIHAGNGRFRGIRQSGIYDADPDVLGPFSGHVPDGVYRDTAFREGLKRLHHLGLSLDAWVLEPQLPDLIDLARAFPDTQIVLDHVGTPLGVGHYKGTLTERFSIWRDNMRTLGKCENVYVKLGGLGMPLLGFPSFNAKPPASTEQLVNEWRPYIEACIEAFGPNRSMFEGNVPPEFGACNYRVLWNVFKTIAARYSKDEKAALFHDTAVRFYRLAI